eukprot:jgi/Chrpa1/14195/Chrysochromulina_OHIO_Genome00022321-RA
MAFASCLFTTVCCTAALLVPHGVPPGRRPRAPVRSGGTLVAVGAAPPAVIVGGGIAGLSTALELAGRGFEVTVLSRDASAAATYAAGGMLAPQSERLDGDSPLLGLAVAARDYYPGWVRELEAASGVDVGLCASGGFLAPAMDGDVVHRWRPPAAGGTSLWLDRPAAAAMEPLLAPEAVGGWWFPQDMSVDPRAVHKALLSACAAAGVMVREGSAAVALELAPHGGSVRAVRLTDGSVMPTPGPLVIANEVAGGEDRGEQPYYDPDSDVGASIRWAMRANKDFIAQLEQGIEPKYGQARPDAAGAAPGGSSAGAASGSVVEEAQEALPTSLPGMADGARLWIVREGEPLPVPIFEGSPPQEFLAGYGDTVLPRPNPTEAPSRGAPPSATSTRLPPPPPLSPAPPAPPAPSWAVPERAAVAMPAAADVPAAVNGKAMPTEQPSGFWAQMFKRPVNGVPVNGVPVNGVAAPVHGADAVASAPTAVATASAPEAKRWALPTMTPPPNAPPPPASDDAIHSTDGYAELTSQDQSHATRDAVIKSARAANKRFREMVLEENDDSALQALIEADLAKYRRGESPNGQERARKSEYAAEARKGAFTEQAIETGSSIAIREFESNFAVELRAAQETMTQVEDVEVADAETPNLLDWWQTQLKELHNTVSGAASFLPTATREKLVGQIVSQEALLREQRDRLAPKKKFGFKNRSKVGTSKTTAPADAAVTPAAPPAAAPLPKADTFQAPAGCQGFRGHSGQTLIRDAGEGSASDFALEQLVGCEVRLLTTSTALWIRGLKQCTVFAVPVGGSIYVTECEECTLYLGSRQLRMHTSTKVAFYIHTSSHPIIEHCTGLTFAPYPSPLPITLAGAFADAALKPEQNQELVDDFDWLKAAQSPNWAVLPEAERQPPAWFTKEGEQAEAAGAAMATSTPLEVRLC